MKRALITGASSGIGRDMARILSDMGYDLILVARRRERLEHLAKHLHTRCDIITTDLTSATACRELHRAVQNKGVTLVINNAGYGVWGEFSQTNLKRELDMLDVNVRAVHILTKLFLRDFVRQGRGRILNVASSAAFLPGPLMASYYASKSYVLRLTQGIREELRHKKSPVYVGVLCPGPVKTEFNAVANVKFALPGMDSYDVAEYAINQMMRGKGVIIPGRLMQAAHVAEHFAPDTLLARIAYHIQQRKSK